MTATPVAVGYSSGRTRKLYYNTGTRAAEAWALIERVSDVKLDPGKSETFKTEIRGSKFEIQQVGSRSQPELSFTYHPVRGITDSVLGDLFDTQGPDADPVEFLDIDGEYTAANTAGLRFFGKLTELPQDEALNKFADLALKVVGVEHYEGTPAALCKPIAWVPPT